MTFVTNNSDLRRLRETFAEKLTGRHVEAEATRQAMRARSRQLGQLWRMKASEDGRLRQIWPTMKRNNTNTMATRVAPVDAWRVLRGRWGQQATGATVLGAIRF